MNKAKINGWLTVGNCHACPDDGYELVIHIFRTDTNDKQERCCVMKPNVDHLRMNYRDGDKIDASNLQNLDVIAAKLRERKRLTLVHCHAGIVRSPTVAIYLLVFVDGMHPYDARAVVTKQIFDQRPGEICNIYHEPFKQIVKLWEERGGREKDTKKAISLFTKIEEVIAAPHGWCTLEKAKALAGIILATRPQIVVEIGVWSGKSLLPMALACQEVGHGKVIGIDPYSPQVSAEGQTPENAKWWGEVADHEAMYQICNALIDQYELKDIVSICRERSDTCAVPTGIGLLHVDGNHSDQALRDVQRFSPNVVPGGFIVLDDLHWSGDGVGSAARWLIEHNYQPLYEVTTTGNDWGVFQRT